jgi:hypothetical protein
MADEIKEMAFSARCKMFFGMLEGQTLTTFMAELKALTDTDKAEFVAAFNKAGLPTLPPKS